MKQPPEFDPRAILETLQRHGVRFLIVGGIAGRLHGSPRMTRDLDICYAREPEDLSRLSAALKDLEVTLRGAPRGLPFKPDQRTLRNGLNFTFDTSLGAFDCLGEASGYTYDVLAPNAERARFEGLDVLVCSLDDLVRMKRASGRPQDLADVETLSKLREIREAQGLYGLAEPRAARRRAPRGTTAARGSASRHDPRPGRARPRR